MPETLSAAAGDIGSEVAESLLATLREAGERGATASELRLENAGKPPANTSSPPALPPRRAALASLIETGRVSATSGRRGGRYMLAELVPSVEGLTAKLLALAAGSPEPSPKLWRKNELTRALSSGERPFLDAALTRLEAQRGLLRVPDGSRGERFLFAEPLRRWLGIADASLPAMPTDALQAPPARAVASDPFDLVTVYRRVVRESGGFPDVKISALRRVLPPALAGILPERLRVLWREGRVTLSLGDWSLAGEEMREASVELDGERYLLVRFEEDAPDEEFSV